MPVPPPPLLGFAAYSGTGKTTLLTQLLPLLNHAGYRVGVIKYSHHDFEIDYPGKDSHRLRMAGANPTLIVSPYRQVRIVEYPPSSTVLLEQQLAALSDSPLDLVLVEGFKEAAMAKIELHRPSLGKPLLYPHDPQIIALASDCTIDIPPGITALDLNQPQQIARFIIKQFLEHAP